MGFLKKLFGGAKGIREAMRESYNRHLRLARDRRIASDDPPHRFGFCYGALGSRYRAGSRPRWALLRASTVTLAIVAVGCGSSSTPTAPTSPTTSAPADAVPANGTTVLYVNPAYRELAIATSMDGRQVVYLGDKASDGLPVRISAAVADVQDPSRRVFLNFDDAGRLNSAVSADGIEMSFAWSASGALITVADDAGHVYTELLPVSAGSSIRPRAIVQIMPNAVTAEQCNNWTAVVGTVCAFNDVISASLPLVCAHATLLFVPLGTACGVIGVGTVLFCTVWNVAAPPGGSPCDALPGGISSVGTNSGVPPSTPRQPTGPRPSSVPDGSWRGSGTARSNFGTNAQVSIQFETRNGNITRLTFPWRIDTQPGTLEASYCGGDNASTGALGVSNLAFGFSISDGFYDFTFQGSFASSNTASGTMQFRRTGARSYCGSATIPWTAKR